MKIVKPAIVTLLLVGCVLMAPAQKTPKEAKSPKEPRTSRYSSTNSRGTFLTIDEDSSISPVQTLITYKEGPLYIMKLEDEKLVELYVGGRKVPADSFYVYNDLIEKIKLQIKKDREQARLDRIQAEKDRAQAEIDREQAGRDRIQADKDREQAERDRGRAEKDREQAERDRVQAQKDAAQAREDARQGEREQEQSVKDRAQAEKDRQQAVLDREQAGRDREQAVKDRAQAEKDREQAGLDRIQAEKDRKQAEIDRAMMKAMISEIIKDGLAPDENSIRSLDLDEDAFFINGKKQTDAVHAKFKEKYIKTPEGRISIHKGVINHYY